MASELTGEQRGQLTRLIDGYGKLRSDLERSGFTASSRTMVEAARDNIVDYVESLLGGDDGE